MSPGAVSRVEEKAKVQQVKETPGRGKAVATERYAGSSHRESAHME